jgi:hypothetical protein
LYHYFPAKLALLDDKSLDLETQRTRFHIQYVQLILAHDPVRA